MSVAIPVGLILGVFPARDLIGNALREAGLKVITLLLSGFGLADAA